MCVCWEAASFVEDESSKMCVLRWTYMKFQKIKKIEINLGIQFTRDSMEDQSTCSRMLSTSTRINSGEISLQKKRSEIFINNKTTFGFENVQVIWFVCIKKKI